MDLFVGDITSYTLHNLQPGTTYDVKVVAQYTGGKSGPLAGQGTTREGPRYPHIQNTWSRFSARGTGVTKRRL